MSSLQAMHYYKSAQLRKESFFNVYINCSRDFSTGRLKPQHLLSPAQKEEMKSVDLEMEIASALTFQENDKNGTMRLLSLRY